MTARRWFLRLLVLALAAPAAALAAEAPQNAGMPQLRFGDPLLIAQVVWLLVIFGLLYHVLSAYGLPAVASVLEERRGRIEADLNAAQRAKAEADAAAAAQREANARARTEAQARIAEALHAAQAAAQTRSEALNARLQAEIGAAEARIAASRDAAMGALRQVSTDAAEALLAKLLPRSTDRATVEAAVTGVLRERGLG